MDRPVMSAPSLVVRLRPEGSIIDERGAEVATVTRDRDRREVRDRFGPVFTLIGRGWSSGVQLIDAGGRPLSAGAARRWRAGVPEQSLRVRPVFLSSVAFTLEVDESRRLVATGSGASAGANGPSVRSFWNRSVSIEFEPDIWPEYRLLAIATAFVQWDSRADD